jgi:hypothetical protein
MNLWVFSYLLVDCGLDYLLMFDYSEYQCIAIN